MIGRTIARRPPRSALVSAALAVAVLLALGCRQDMHDQPKYEPFEASTEFANGMASRSLPAGTVARGQLREDSHLYEGKDAAGELVSSLPESLPLSRELLLRGRSRYEIYCSVCHDSAGTGRGMIVRRGFKQPPSMHEQRLREMPLGYFYDVISQGFGVMSSYASQLPVEDRWAVAAYLRALQLSQDVALEDLPAATQDAFHHALELQKAAAEHGHGGEHGGGHAGDGHSAADAAHSSTEEGEHGGHP